MIKLFRNFRRDLLNEGKTSKYFKYAIGEIILVVVGILIALQINNWNETRKNRTKENVLVNQLIQDLNQTDSDLKEIKAFFLNRADMSIDISHSYWTKKHLSDTLLFHFSDIMSYRRYNPILGTSLSLVNSGNIDLIQSKNVRKAITNYIENINAHKEDIKRYEESYYRQGVYDFKSEFDGYSLLGARLKEKMIERSRSRLKSYPDSIEEVPFPVDIEDIYKSRKAYNAIQSLIISHRNTYLEYYQIEKETQDLLNLLNSEGYEKNILEHANKTSL